LIVLVTNDDGIRATGIQVLARALAQVADVTVVAPEHERSATGHAITLHKPLRAARTVIPDLDAPAWATNGTPADCVALGVLDLVAHRPDLVISGINAGPNIGSDLTYSGTVSGAMEGAIIGIPSIAVSVGAFEDVRFDVAAEVAVRLVEVVGRGGLPPETLLNVNVPNLEKSDIRGITATRQAERGFISRLEKRKDPRGRTYYWLAGERSAVPYVEGTDAWALHEKFVSVTPLTMRMSAEGALPWVDRVLSEIRL
jgi:5'-nucleotidase